MATQHANGTANAIKGATKPFIRIALRRDALSLSIRCNAARRLHTVAHPLPLSLRLPRRNYASARKPPPAVGHATSVDLIKYLHSV